MPETRPTEATETLRCNFTDAEKIKLGSDLAEALNNLEALDDEESTIKTAMKSKRSLHEATVGTLARQLSAGFTMRPIKCRLVYDDPNPNEVSTYRLDTEELVKTRPFSEKERQADLPLETATAEQSESNIVEFFKAPESAQVDTRTDDEPADEAEPIEDAQAADPLELGIDPEKERQDARRSEAAAVRAAKSNLEKM
jgi:hypothetical protein